jgi:hypothetical protein
LTGSPTASPKSLSKRASSRRPENGQRLAGNVGLPDIRRARVATFRLRRLPGPSYHLGHFFCVVVLSHSADAATPSIARWITLRFEWACRCVIGHGVDLQLDLKGNARLLWEAKGNVEPSITAFVGGPSAPWAIPSPDGRHLAICVWSLNANIWMLENF